MPFHVLIRSVTVGNDSLLFNGTNFKVDERGYYRINFEQADDTQPIIKHRYNNIEFKWAAPFFEQEEEMQYSYRLDEFVV